MPSQSPSRQPFLKKLGAAPAASVHILDPAKAARMKAKTMVIPAPADVAGAIAAIPKGTRTIVELRRELAAQGQAQTACPAATTKYWKWLAWAYDEPRQRAVAIFGALVAGVEGWQAEPPPAGWGRTAGGAAASGGRGDRVAGTLQRCYSGAAWPRARSRSR